MNLELNMLIISFAWTLSALLAGKKTVTRRDWPDTYARRFRPADLAQGFDKGARNGGKCRATIRICSLRREALSRLIDEPDYGRSELALEGGLWPSVEAFCAQYRPLKHGDPYRLEFELVEITGGQTELPLRDPVPEVHAEFCRLTGQTLKLSLFQNYWKELVHTHGFTVADVSVAARYLVKQVRSGKRLEGCLKIHNFAMPAAFDSDLAIAKRSMPVPRRADAELVQPIDGPPANDEDIRRRTAAGLGEFRSRLQSGSKDRESINL